MGIIDPEVSSKVQPELIGGESLLWTGKPNPRVIFHADDVFLIPFSLLWGGFAIFWEMGVLGLWGNFGKGGPAPVFFQIWGIPFVVIGQYVIWGRFVWDAWLKKRTYYAVTDRRVLVVQEGRARKTSWLYINSIPTVEREGPGPGTIWFGPKGPLMTGRRQTSRGWSRFSVGGVPIFADIDDLDSVYRLVLELREKSDHTATAATK